MSDARDPSGAEVWRATAPVGYIGTSPGAATLPLLAIACSAPPPPPAGPPCDVDPVGRVCTIAGSGLRGAGDDALPARETHLFLPTAVAFEPEGRPVIVDYNNMRLRRLDDDGILRTVAGTGQHGYAPDGVPALDCPLENPIDAVIGPDGTTYVMEQHGARVLRVDPDGLLTVYAGSATNPGYEGYAGDGGPARDASLSEASGLALGDDGTLYLADTLNHVVREIRADGTIWTLAGDGEPGFADGPGAEARFQQPYAAAFADGALYVVERLNHALRRVDVATGEVTTLAGTGEPGADGDGGPAVDAELNSPLGVAVGPDGGIYVADGDNHAIRRVDPDDGTIETVVGVLGESGDLAEGDLPTDARLDWPNDVAFDADGGLLVVDTLHDVVRRIEGFLR